LTIGGMPPTPTLTFDLGSKSSLAKSICIRKMCERGFLISSVFFLMLAHEPRDEASVLENLDSVLSQLETLILSGHLDDYAQPASNEAFARPA
jgi:glutamate-1-semialdehyde 2,1-aminomutase